jgi:AAA domain/UvrD-like helicase C-terminal domain
MAPMRPPDIPFLSADGVILAGAGAGKTTTTVSLHAAAEERGVRALVITFTNATVNDYIERANRDKPGLASSESVFTFHKLASHLVRGPGGADNSQHASLDTVVALAVEHVHEFGLSPDMADVGVVLVDESQDCSRENYDLVRAVAAAAGATVAMIGDANQSLYAFRNASPAFLLGHGKDGGYRHALDINWRSSPEIVALTGEFMRHPLEVSPRPGAEHGPLARLVVCDARTVAKEVVDTALSALAQRRTVMVVGRSKRPRFEKGSLIRVGLQMIINEMNTRGVLYARMFREASDDDGSGAVASSLAPTAVNVLTIHGSKGLEADTVVVIDALDERLGSEPAPDQLELMYVALSRARTELVIVNSREAKTDPVLERAIRKGKCSRAGDRAPTVHPVKRETRDTYSVTQLLNDRTLLDESSLLDFSRELAIEPHRIAWPSSDDPSGDLPEIDDLRTLYGNLAENCAQMAYNANRYCQDCKDALPPGACIVDRLTMYAMRRIAVPAMHARALSNLYAMTGARRSDPISKTEVAALQERLRHQAHMCGRTIHLLDFIEAAMVQMNIDSAVLTGPSATQRIPISELHTITNGYNAAKSNDERLPHLFAACMFFYQLDHHAGYRWGRDYSQHVCAFAPHLQRINEMVRDLPDGCTFEKDVRFRFLRLVGRADISSQGRIVELKWHGIHGMKIHAFYDVFVTAYWWMCEFHTETGCKQRAHVPYQTGIHCCPECIPVHVCLLPRQ